MLSRHRRGTTCAAASIAALLLVSSALAARPSPTLPAQIPAHEREKLQEIADGASVSARATGEPFLARPDVFEFLLDHPEFATHVTRALKLGRYRIWHDSDGRLWLDDGWGVVGQFSVVYASSGTRVVFAHGQYQSGLLPSIGGQAVVVIEYGLRPAADRRSLVSPTVTGFVRLDSKIIALASMLAGSVATAKAEKEARSFVRIFARVSRAIEDNPARVRDVVGQRPDVPAADLEEFRRLLDLR